MRAYAQILAEAIATVHTIEKLPLATAFHHKLASLQHAEPRAYWKQSAMPTVAIGKFYSLVLDVVPTSAISAVRGLLPGKVAILHK